MANKLWSRNACFYDAFRDLVALEQYIAILEVELPRVVEAERRRIWRDVNSGDEEGEQYGAQAEYELDEGITTRLLTGTAVVATWGTYESLVKRTAEIIRESKKLKLKLSDIKGSTFIDSARKYFQSV